MIWLEMSRDEIHGGPNWEFSKCLWSPSRKTNQAKWAFWESLLRVRQGDPVLHLKGITPDAYFVGHSIAETNGIETLNRPPLPEGYDYATTFYRVDLTAYEEFPAPISLTSLFDDFGTELREYFALNKKRKRQRSHLFYVPQAGALQCLNGAYLSELPDELFDMIFQLQPEVRARPRAAVDVNTKDILRQVKARVGHGAFSDNVKKNYGAQCCFPGCEIRDTDFLVGSHIARWSDVPELRGKVSNGLCLCLLHDRAFELGLFTLALDFKVRTNPQKCPEWLHDQITSKEGQGIRVGEILPAVESLQHHWKRVKFRPD